MHIELLLAERAWRLRAYLGSSADEMRASLSEALRALHKAEQIASRHQLPERASCQRCAYVAPWGSQCQAVSCTPELYGFLSMNPDPRERPERQACWSFFGRLCERHQAHLVIPPSDWWPVAFEWRARELREAIWI